MSDNVETWDDILIEVGEKTYHEEYHRFLDELAPNGRYSPEIWTEASAKAIIRAVRAMLAESEGALLTEIDYAHDEP